MFNLFKKKSKINNTQNNLVETREDKIQKLKTNGIITLGASSKTEIDVYENTKKAINEMGLDIDVYNIVDSKALAKFSNIAAPPALIINNKAVAQGYSMSKEEIIELIKKEID